METIPWNSANLNYFLQAYTSLVKLPFSSAWFPVKSLLSSKKFRLTKTFFLLTWLNPFLRDTWKYLHTLHRFVVNELSTKVLTEGPAIGGTHRRDIHCILSQCPLSRILGTGWSSVNLKPKWIVAPQVNFSLCVFSGLVRNRSRL